MIKPQHERFDTVGRIVACDCLNVRANIYRIDCVSGLSSLGDMQ